MMAVCPRVGQADKAPVSLLTHLNTIFLKAKKGSLFALQSAGIRA